MKILIFRSGAYGDCIIITPVIRYLHSQGNELYVVTSKRGMDVFKNNPHIKELIQHDESIQSEKLADRLDYLRRKYKCDKVIDFCESIEVSLSQHPLSPNYKLPKYERLKRFNRNFYEYAFEHAKLDWNGIDLKPELFFGELELSEVTQYLKLYQYNVLIGLSGSGTNKCWPWMMDMCNQIGKELLDVHFIIVGDTKCQILEDSMEGNMTKLSGKISMRQSMALTSMVDLVISPDTGIIHAAGCYDTNKILLVGHNTQECVSKHFKNCYTIESDPELAPCSPCLFLIYNMKMQCPVSRVTHGSICMSDGIPLEKVYNQFKEIYVRSKETSRTA